MSWSHAGGVSHLAGVCSDVCHGRGSNSAIVDDTAVAVVPQQVLRNGGGATGLDLVLVAENGHPCRASAIVQKRPPVAALC